MSATVHGWSALFTRDTAPMSVMLAGGVAVHALSVQVVSTILPSAVAEIGGIEYFAWSTTLALVGAILSSVCSPALSAWAGPRGAYWTALAVFAAGSAVCGAAPSMGILLAGRCLQGIGGGLLTSLAYGFIRRNFAAELRTRGIAMLSGLWGIAALSGPLVGGLLASVGLWRWAFWMDVPFAALVATLVHRVLPARPAKEPAYRFGAVGQLALLGLSALPIAWGGASASSTRAAIGTSIGLGIFAFMMWRERQAVEAGTPHLLPAGSFDPRSELGAVTLTMALMGGCLSAILFLPLIASRAYGFPPLARGYFSGLMAISWTLAALATASVTHARTRRWIIVAGPVLMLAGLCIEAIALANNSSPTMMLAMIPLGAGIGGAWAHLGTLLMETALPAERDLASACITTMQLIAGAIGAAVAGTIANLAGLAAAATAGDIAGIVHAALWLFLCFALIPAIGTLTAARAVKHGWR